MFVREAAEQDWPQIFPIFAAIVADGRTYVYPEDLPSEDAQALWMTTPPGRTTVAVEGDRIVGTATMGPNRSGRGSHIATGSFMVDTSSQGKGIGRALGEEFLTWARSAGYHGVQFNAVVETNTAAVRLWQDLGFEILTTVPGAFDHPEHGYVGLHIMFHGFSVSSPGE